MINVKENHAPADASVNTKDYCEWCGTYSALLDGWLCPGCYDEWIKEQQEEELPV